MGTKTPPWPHYPKWTTAKWWSFIRSGLRSKWLRWPPRYEALEAARRAKPKNKAGKHKWEYKCSKCRKWWLQKDVEVDHIEPVGSLNGYQDVEWFIRRLFVPSNKLRILCKTCHTKVTNESRKK